MAALLACSRAKVAPWLWGTGLPTLRRQGLHTTAVALQPRISPAQIEENQKEIKNRITVYLNGMEVLVPPGITVLQACQEVGHEIPRFCYHERLSVAGNCRMCLVEVEGPPKPVASCAMPIMPNMKIWTKSKRTVRAREGVMEFLLMNHPLDCPICDQAGECDLQDEYQAFGANGGRFREWKRTVEDKDLGPLVKTVMTRCIQCTRCIRFADEIAGTSVLGATGRGNGMEIGTYVPEFFDSEISGNVIDLCPVGALTAKPSAFTARPWDLRPTQTIDVSDAVGSNMRIDTRGADIMRVLPRLHEDINEEWISDKARFQYDGLKRQRLDVPYVRHGSSFKKVTWKTALETVAEKLLKAKGSEILAVAGPQADLETLVSCKDLLTKFGCSDFRSDSGDILTADVRSDYLFNSSIQSIEDADHVLLVGTNPRMEAATVNARIRKCVLQYGQKVASIGPEFDPAYHAAVNHLGDDLSILEKIVEGSHPYCKTLEKAETPMIVLGISCFKRADALAIQPLLARLVQKYPKLVQEGEEPWNGINILHAEASRVGQLDVGFVPGPRVDITTWKNAKVVYLLGCDTQSTLDRLDPEAFVIYQGHHGDMGAERADVILPCPASTEKLATYVNLEGRAQKTTPCMAPIGEARYDWLIFRALSEIAGPTKQLPYESYDDIERRIREIAPTLAHRDILQGQVFLPNGKESKTMAKSQPAVAIQSGPIEPLFTDFWQTDAVCRASVNMAKSSRAFPNARNSYKKKEASQ